jgi:hypothetical protein
MHLAMEDGPRASDTRVLVVPSSRSPYYEQDPFKDEPPTLVSGTYTSDRALDQLKRASREALTEGDHDRVRDMARRMVFSGLVSEADAKPFILRAMSHEL